MKTGNSRCQKTALQRLMVVVCTLVATHASWAASFMPIITSYAAADYDEYESLNGDEED